MRQTCESAGSAGRPWTRRHSSASEILTALDTADAWGWIVDARKARAILDRLLALLWRLVHGRPALPAGSHS